MIIRPRELGRMRAHLKLDKDKAKDNCPFPRTCWTPFNGKYEYSSCGVCAEIFPRTKRAMKRAGLYVEGLRDYNEKIRVQFEMPWVRVRRCPCQIYSLSYIKKKVKELLSEGARKT